MALINIVGVGVILLNIIIVAGILHVPDGVGIALSILLATVNLTAQWWLFHGGNWTWPKECLVSVGERTQD